MIGNQGENLVFLLSMPRSGSTLLSLMLASHEEICCPPEPWIVLALAEYLGLGGVREIPYGREWAEIAAIEFLLGAERTERGALGKVLQALGRSSGRKGVERARETLLALYQMRLDGERRKVFVDKTPRYYAILDLVGEIFPKSKSLLLLRNPMDIFASYKSTWNASIAMFEPGKASVLARDFCEGLFTLARLANSAKGDLLVLRYEDLVADPEKALRATCAFAGVEFSVSMLAYADNGKLIAQYRQSPVGDPVASSRPMPANSRTVNAWDQRLELSEIQGLIDVLGTEIFERLGYGEVVAKLRTMPLAIPTEDVALVRRKAAMQCLIREVREEPFSTWSSFLSPLQDSRAEQMASLAVNRQLEIEKAAVQQELRIVEASCASQVQINQRQEIEFEALRSHVEGVDSDRAARLEVIRKQQADLEGLQSLVAQIELDRAARLDVIQTQQAQIEEWQQRFEISEADRAARLDVIQTQHAQIEEWQRRFEVSESDRAQRLLLIHKLQADYEELQRRLESSDADRAARLEAIQKQRSDADELHARMRVLESDHARSLAFSTRQHAEIEALRRELESSESERAARLKVIQGQLSELEEVQRKLECCEAGQIARLEMANRRDVEIAALNRDLATARSDCLESLEQLRRTQEELEQLRGRFELSEADRLRGAEVGRRQQLELEQAKRNLELADRRDNVHLEMLSDLRAEVRELQSIRGFLAHLYLKLKQRASRIKA